MPRYKVPVFKNVIFRGVCIVDAEDEIEAADYAVDIAEEHRFEWGAADDWEVDAAWDGITQVSLDSSGGK